MEVNADHEVGVDVEVEARNFIEVEVEARNFIDVDVEAETLVSSSRRVSVN